ncbi:4'-phosphopantetheinyl transferase family protein [Streptomyces apocyni]|uniref:4'-phosphopantetheinyl transferase family protein n=1 Tax=Streptomyces apocyni TaxID=2654677 RepID=UPI0018D0573F|nr:4'-phosphopantetheinyl transferase superfamily protein [Streptomyces apocyni]
MTATGSAPGPAPVIAAEDGDLHLWALRQPWTDEGSTVMVKSELDDAELERAASFVQPHDRLLYLSAHIALRRLLAAYVGIPPAHLRLGRAPCPGCGGPHGRPVVLDTDLPLHFSLSHSHGLAIFGVATSPVGVDVERVPSLETAELCLPALHPEEQAELARLPEAELPVSFGRLWTRKEAYLKGIGTGLSRDLAADYLGEREDGVSDRPKGWVVRSVTGYPSHVTAAALLTDDDHCTTARRLPTECLYIEDASELIAVARQQVCTALPANGAGSE